jgi:hypothetical protein
MRLATMFLVAIIFAQPVSSANWYLFEMKLSVSGSDSSLQVFYYDSSSISITTDSICSVWCKNTQISRREKETTYQVYLSEFNMKNKMVRFPCIILYDTEGNGRKVNDPNCIWEYVAPETIVEILYDLMHIKMWDRMHTSTVNKSCKK